MTRKRSRDPMVIRDRPAERLAAFIALLAGVQLTEALRARLQRDRGVSAVGGYRQVQREIEQPWVAPHEYLDQARDIAVLLARHGAPRELVLPVLIAEADADLGPCECGWEDWARMHDIHAKIRAKFTSYEMNDEHLALFEVNLGVIPADEEWNGYAPRPVDAYTRAPGAYHPRTALAFAETLRDLLYDRDVEGGGAALAEAEPVLAEIENAASAAIGWLKCAEPASDAVLPFGEWDAQDDEAHSDHLEADTRARAARACRELSSLLDSLPPKMRRVTELERELIDRGTQPTDEAIARMLGNGATAAAVRKLRYRRKRLVASRNVPFHPAAGD